MGNLAADSRSGATYAHRFRLSVADFEAMATAGILHEDERIELVDGELIAMPPIGREHAGKTRRLLRAFSRVVGDEALVDVQNPLVLDEYNEPEPDLMLLRYRADYYEGAKPTPKDVLLLVEVSDASLVYDKGTKLPLYARHGVPEVWLLDLRNKRLEVYRKPSADGYREVLIPEPSSRIAPVLLSGAEIPVAALW